MQGNILVGRSNIFVSVLVLVIAVASWGVLRHMEGQARTDIGKLLGTALQTAHVGIRSQLDSQKKSVEFWANNAPTRNAVIELKGYAKDTVSLLSSRAQKKIRVWMNTLIRAPGYSGFFIVNGDNTTLASSRDSEVGLVSPLQSNFFMKVLAGEALVGVPHAPDGSLKDFSGDMIEDLASMFVVAPIEDSRGNIIAVLAVRIKSGEILAPIFVRGRFGSSGETYAFNKDGVLISESRFNDDLRRIGLITGKYSELNVEVRDPGVNVVLGEQPILPRDQQPLTRMARSAVSGENGMDLDGYRDYRGVPVVGGWLWDDELGFGIATEIDVSEAYASFYSMRYAIIGFSGLSICVLIVLAIASAYARKKISESYENVHMLLASAGEGICGLDNQGRAIFVNPAACNMLGFEEKELIGHLMHPLIHHSYPDGSDYPHQKCCMNAASIDGIVHRIDDEVLWRKDGTSFPVEYTSTPIRKYNQVTGAVITFRDVSQRRQAEAALSESEEMFRAIAESAAVALFISIVETGKIVYCNAAAGDLLRLPLDQIIGRQGVDFYCDEKDREEIVDELATQHAGRNGELRLRRGDGSEAVCLDFVQVIEYRGAPAWLTVNIDVSELRQAENKLRESEQFLTAAIDNISDGFVLCDSDNRIKMFNDKFRILYPNSRDLIKEGVLFEDFLRGGAERGEYPDADGRVDEWVTERSQKGRESATTFDQPLISDRWAQISIGRLPEGGWVGIHVDITDLKKAMESADKANLAKSEFLSSMSHELRTPMNAILGFAQMLEYNPKEPLTDAQKGSVDHIMKGGQHLLELINEILDLAKIEAGKVDLSIEDISPTDILDECLSLVSVMAGKRNIDISVPDAGSGIPKVRADHTRLTQVLLNLMSNAVKYNRENGTISIAMEEVADNKLRIAVSDSGAGIPQDKQDQLFQPFSRLGAENSEIEGTGIGLVVCKNLIELMDGAVGMESEVGRGSTFWIELPLANADQAEAVEATGLPISQIKDLLPTTSGTLLYVEDNPANLRLMELIVSRVEGLSMISTHTGELGVELARVEKPDIIILDINLPGMNGIETLKKLRSYEEIGNVPVLAMSAAATERDIQKGMEAGFLRYLTKPVRVLEVVDAIKAALETN